MKISYDYDELINEIEEEIEDGILTLEDSVQILRAKESINGEYFPIIDWYYSEEDMKELLKVDMFESKEEKKERESIEESYAEDCFNLESITVKDFLKEMNIYNSIA